MTSLIPPSLLLGNKPPPQQQHYPQQPPKDPQPQQIQTSTNSTKHILFQQQQQTYAYTNIPPPTQQSAQLPTTKHIERMHELEMSNQSHTIMLLKTEINNKDMEIVEFKAQLQDYRLKCEKLLKDKDKVIQERNQANASLREELELKMQMISALQKDMRAYEGRQQLFNTGMPNGVIETHTKELSKKLREKEMELARFQHEKEELLTKKSLEMNSIKQKLHECERQNAVLSQALRDRKEKELESGDFLQKQQVESQTHIAEVEHALRQARSRIATLEAEVSVSRAEALNAKVMLGDSERAVAVLKEKVKLLEEQIRVIEPKARDLQRLHELAIEVDQVHAEKAKLRSHVQRLSEENTNLKANIDSVQEELKQKSSRIALLEGKYDQQTEILAGLRQENARKEKALRDMETHTQEDFERKIREAGSEVAQLRAKLDAITNNTMPLRQELSIAHNDRQRLTQLVEQLRNELALRVQELQDVMQQQGTLAFANQITELEGLTEMQGRSITELQAELNHRKRLLEEFENETQAKNTTIAKLKGDITARDARVRQLEDAIQRHETLKAHNEASGQTQPVNNGRDMEALVSEMEADQVRYRAEVKAQFEELSKKTAQIEKLEKENRELLADNKTLRGKQQQLQKSKSIGNFNRYEGGADMLDMEDKRTLQRAKYEAEACAAELASLRQMVRQAQLAQGQDVGGLGNGVDNLNELRVHTPPSTGTLLGSLAAVKHEAAALRSTFTSLYAESLSNNCAVQ